MSDSCNPMGCSLPGSSIHGILQARILEWVAISFSRGSSWPRNRTQVSCITGSYKGSPLLEWQLFLSPRGLPNPGIEPRSPTLQVDSLLSEPPGKPKNTGVGSLSLLQRIFLTQELNLGLLHCRWILCQLSYEGSPNMWWWFSLIVKLCPTLCGSMDCSPPGSSVHGILQARILEWVAISFSRGSSQPRN